MLRSLSISVFAVSLLATSLQAENWPGWRGPRGDGTSHAENAPTQWNGETGENIRWRVAIP